jgi:nanoRNase/pAp phosphatase (c-di-AMP/oligoRNAs hydrolase)
MRLVTRADLDGLACAVLLRQVKTIETVKFAHPKDMQDGRIPVDRNDIIANLPYVQGTGMWFDHHYSESLRMHQGDYDGRLEMAPSTARVIASYYGFKRFARYEDMIMAVDKIDMAELSREDILHPKGWVLLAYLADARTGLGYYHDFTISNFQLMMKLIDLLESKVIDEILADVDVRERIKRYRSDHENYVQFLTENSYLDRNVVVTDARNQNDYYAGNRFLVYSLFPTANISIRIIDGKNKAFAVLALGHSILNRTAKTNIGKLMREYGGGGHIGAGTCQVAYTDVDRILGEVLAILKKNEGGKQPA